MPMARAMIYYDFNSKRNGLFVLTILQKIKKQYMIIR